MAAARASMLFDGEHYTRKCPCDWRGGSMWFGNEPRAHMDPQANGIDENLRTDLIARYLTKRRATPDGALMPALVRPEVA